MFNMFKLSPKYWVTPGGKYWELFADMAQQPHLLIAGATGSGKSVVINGIIGTTLRRFSPSKAQFILIDPKRVELIQYRNIPHCIMYATEPADRIAALQRAIDITEQRYRTMAQNGQRKYNGSDLYVVIDELADMMTTQKKAMLPLLQRLCQIGRAAKVHVIAATQCPLAKILPTEVKVNFDSRVALRTECAQDSRNIMRQNGCELLPRFGKGYYKKPEGTELYNIPMINDSELDSLCSWWTSDKCKQ